MVKVPGVVVLSRRTAERRGRENCIEMAGMGGRVVDRP